MGESKYNYIPINIVQISNNRYLHVIRQEYKDSGNIVGISLDIFEGQGETASKKNHIYIPEYSLSSFLKAMMFGLDKDTRYKLYMDLGFGGD